MECLYIVPQHPATDQQVTGADTLYNSCVQLISNCDFKILVGYVYIYSFYCNHFIYMWHLSVLDGNGYNRPEDV
jgi:hypothetical protein